MGTVKLCECGCGLSAPIATRNDSAKGRVKGQAMRFRQGHGQRLRTGSRNSNWRGGTRITNGYRQQRVPGHPGADACGYVYEHRLVVERALGRYLLESEEVHHINGDKLDNHPQNLVACQDRAYHFVLEQRQRALDACGHADWRICQFCKQYGDPVADDMAIGTRSRAVYHRRCHREYQRERRRLRVESTSS